MKMFQISNDMPKTKATTTTKVTFNNNSKENIHAVVPLAKFNFIDEFDFSDLPLHDNSDDKSTTKIPSDKTVINKYKSDYASDQQTVTANDSIKQTKVLGKNSASTPTLATTKKVIKLNLDKQLFDKNKNIIAQRFFTMSLLEYACSLSTKNNADMQILYKDICNKLVEYDMIPAVFTYDIFKPVRLQYNLLIRKIFEQNRNMPPQITYKPLLRNNNDKLHRSHSVDAASISTSGKYDTRASLVNFSELNTSDFLYSRYASEFTEIERLATGGFGSVYRAKNNLDGNDYAIKKIYFKKNSADLSSRVLREIKFFSSLHHPNIVNYHNCWLESCLVPLKSKINSFDSQASDSHKKRGKYKQNKMIENHIDQFIMNVSQQLSDDYDDDDENDRNNYTIKPKQHKNDSNNNSSDSNSTETDSSEVGFFRKPKSVSSDISFTNSDPVDSSSQINDTFGTKNSNIDLSNLKDLRAKESALTNRIILYIQMKLCDCTLKQWLQERNEQIFRDKIPLDTKICMDLFHQILEAVTYIHSKGIIHRDLKPGNIFLLREQMKIKIGDFGLACAELVPNIEDFLLLYSPTDANADFNATIDFNEFEKLRSTSNSEHTRGVGTSLYASPEQLSLKCYDNKTDMYSLGIILFELFQPFHTEMEKHVSIQSLKNANVFPPSLRETFPKQCEVIEALLNRDPTQRPSSLTLLNSELFMDRDQIIEELRKIISIRDNELVVLRNSLKEKEELLEQKDDIIKTLVGLKF